MRTVLALVAPLAFTSALEPDGVGMFCSQGRREQLRAGDENGDPLLDVDDEPCGPYVVTE